MSKVIEKTKAKKGDSARISPKDRCAHVSKDGAKCKQKAWRGRRVCYQHDPEMGELRRKAGRPRNPVRLMSVRDVQELLAETLEELRAGEIGPGEAYATGYLAQLALAAQGASRRESKLDVKHFWEMVDLGAAVEKAAELQKERNKEREAQQAQEAEEDSEELVGEPSAPHEANLAGAAAPAREV